MKRCTAKSKRSGGQCRKAARNGRDVCHMHGGGSKKGFESATFKHGRRSRYAGALAPILGEQYLAALRDPNQLSLAQDIALLDMRVAVLLKRAQDGGAAAGWREAQKAFEEFAEAQAKQDRSAALTALHELSAVLRRGAAAEAAWDGIADLAWKKRPKLVQAEMRRQVAQAELVHLSTVTRLLELLGATVTRHVNDPETLRAIRADIERIAGASGFEVSDDEEEGAPLIG